MLIFIDSEGEPVQEFTALYVDEQSGKIVDVFHQHVRYPLPRDKDYFARRHIHGLCRNYLQHHGLRDESDLRLSFKAWLKTHPFSKLVANAPQREISLLSMQICDIHLKPWKERINCDSHKVALFMKNNQIPICNTICYAHKCFIGWRPKKCNALSESDTAKSHFGFHCSLYDTFECSLFYFNGE